MSIDYRRQNIVSAAMSIPECLFTAIVDMRVGAPLLAHRREGVDRVDEAVALASDMLRAPPLQEGLGGLEELGVASAGLREALVVSAGGRVHFYQRVPGEDDLAFLSIMAPSPNIGMMIAKARLALAQLQVVQ